MLTHKKIAGTLKYGGLLGAYSTRNRFGRDELLDDSDPFVQIFDKIEQLCRAYQQQDFGSVFQLIERGNMRLRRHSDKARISGSLGKLASSRAAWNVDAVLDFVFKEQLLVKTKAIRALEERLDTEGPDEYVARDRTFLHALHAVPYREVIELSKFRDGDTPFSTQHGVKGTEYVNVIVAIDDEAWNQYDMGKMLANSDRLSQRMERSRNLFYVCCSRAKSGLAVVFLSKLSSAAIDTARNWFGAENVY